MKEMWNQRFAQESYVYGTEPNVFFKSQLDPLSSGKILLPAEGEGRNAVYAASLGWQVTAYDYSEAGKEKALRLAKQRSVTIDYRVHDFGEVELEAESFDCAGLFFAHFPADKRPAYHRKIVKALKPGGLVILEGFSKAQLGKTSGGPKNLDLLFSSAELREEFSGLSSLEITEVETELKEGEYHAGLASLIRLTGRK